MIDLCAEIGYQSINHFGEVLCGDHVDMVEQSDDVTVVVLADGLGSGVKASILSTLTSKIISTMMAQGLSLEECVDTIAATLPICSVRGVAYSTFTILHLVDNRKAELIQYDNPAAILMRDGRNCAYPTTEMNIGGKKILKSAIPLQEDDVFILMSDGCPHAGIGRAYNFGWRREDIIAYMETALKPGCTAQSLSALLVDKCDELYGHMPGDDATACVVRIRRREPVSILFGPPRAREDDERMLSLFFSKPGKHIVCGGTTSSLAARYLGKPLKISLTFDDPDIPPTAELEGADLVTEGVITVNRALEYAKDALSGNALRAKWSHGHDGAGMISRMLFDKATDINFYVGRAINPAHQDPDLPISFSIKMNLVKDLSKCLKQMGKRVKVSYF